MRSEPKGSTFVFEYSGCHDGMITRIECTSMTRTLFMVFACGVTLFVAAPCVSLWSDMVLQDFSYAGMRAPLRALNRAVAVAPWMIALEVTARTIPRSLPQTVVQVVGDVDFVISSRLARNLDCYVQCQLMTRIPLTAHAATAKRLALTPDRSCTTPQLITLADQVKRGFDACHWRKVAIYPLRRRLNRTRCWRVRLWICCLCECYMSMHRNEQV
jgi:hypothetical protein